MRQMLKGVGLVAGGALLGATLAGTRRESGIAGEPLFDWLDEHE